MSMPRIRRQRITMPGMAATTFLRHTSCLLCICNRLNFLRIADRNPPHPMCGREYSWLAKRNSWGRTSHAEQIESTQWNLCEAGEEGVEPTQSKMYHRSLSLVDREVMCSMQFIHTLHFGSSCHILFQLNKS